MTTQHPAITRRAALSLGLGATAAVALSAAGCGGDSGGGAGAGGKVEQRFTWWGNDTRNANTQAIIEAYQKENPDVTIKPETGDWSGYWDKLATQVAANDAPDIIQMDEKYIREYGGRGALLDLSKYGVDTSKFAPGTVEAGQSDDGLMGLNAGINAPVILANPQVFSAAKVELPDDKTWTWQDFRDICAEITAKSPSGTFGTGSPMSNDAAIGAWLRQHGKSLFTDTELGFSPADIAQWFDFNMELLKAKGLPSADAIVEDSGKALDQSSFATGKLGFGFLWSNQVNALDKTTGEDLKILRYPSTTGESGGANLWYKASMFWSASARTKNPEAAGKFISFLANSRTAGEAGLTERGVPPNLEVREAITAKLSASDKKVITFLDTIEPELGEAPKPPLVGTGNFPDVALRYAQDVMFGRQSSMDAATKLVDEVKSNISS